AAADPARARGPLRAATHAEHQSRGADVAAGGGSRRVRPRAPAVGRTPERAAAIAKGGGGEKMTRILAAALLLFALPAITKPVLFDTPEADRIAQAMQIFPPDNPWNEDVSALPTLPNSDAI